LRAKEENLRALFLGGLGGYAGPVMRF
jgi:hypothetical protein